jgi:hypothetical protein
MCVTYLLIVIPSEARDLLIGDFADKKIPHPLRGIRDDSKRKTGFGMTAKEKWY